MVLTSPQSDFSKLYQTNIKNDWEIIRFLKVVKVPANSLYFILSLCQTKQKRTCFKEIRPEFSNPKRLMVHFQLSQVTWERHVIWWNVFSWALSLGNVGTFDGTFSAEPGRLGNVAPSGNPASPGTKMITISDFPYRKRAIAFHQTKRLFPSRKVAISAPPHEKRALFNPILAARLSMQLFTNDPGRPASVPSMERFQVSQLGCKSSTFPSVWWNVFR